MSVQRAAMVEDLVDSGKRFTTDQVGDIVMGPDDDVIEGTAEKVEEKTHGGKLDEFAGETIDQAAGNTSPPEVKPSEPKPAELPIFDINKFNIKTAHGVKAASAELITVLSAYPQEERGSVFMQSSGLMVAEAMHEHGLALEVKKIEALGINLPPVDDQPQSGNTSKIPFKAKEGAAV